MRVKFVFGLVFLLGLNVAAQRVVDVTHEVAITVPEKCTIGFDEEQKLLVISEKEYNCKVKFFPFHDGFRTLDSKWTKKRRLDTLFFDDLRDRVPIRTEKNKVFEFGKDYVKKTYFNNGVYDVTFSTHTVDGMYLFRFTTNDKLFLPIFDEMLKSTVHHRGNIVKRTQFAFGASPILFWVLILLTIPCAWFLHRKGDLLNNIRNAVAVFVAVAGMILWGFGWDMGLATGPLVLAFILSFFSCVLGFYLTPA